MTHRLPCLIAGSCTADVSLPSVDIDYHAACHHAVGVFRRKGHDRLALVIPSAGLTGDLDSEAGFCAAMKGEHPPMILRHDGTRENIIRQVENSLRLPSPPTGFLVARSAHVLTVLTLLMRRGYQLPTQAAIISRDNDAFLDFVTPSVARYNSNPEKFSRQLSRIILQMLHSGVSPDQPIRIMPHFLPGETV
jgi:LacI family transcriptional regulator